MQALDEKYIESSAPVAIGNGVFVSTFLVVPVQIYLRDG